jgi:copper homeostasis protein
MLYGIKIEICAGSFEDVVTACRYNEVDRLELNSHLEEDGLSIDHLTFDKIRAYTNKQLFCMVRNRPGSFQYTEEEKNAMRQEADYFLSHGADGIVFGCLNQDNTIDLPFTKQMIDLIHSSSAEAVFHKAFDQTPDYFTSAKALAQLHCDRILTSAGKPDCLTGATILHDLEEQYGDQIQILPGGGINSTNLSAILKQTGCTRFHMSLRSDDPEQKLIDVLEVIRSMHAPAGQHVLTREDAEMFEEDHYEAAMEDQEDTHEH